MQESKLGRGEKGLGRGGVWIRLLPCLLLLLMGCRGPEEEGFPVLRTGSFSFPALASVLPPVVRALQLDRRYGFRLEEIRYGSVSAYYAALATGEVDTLPGGPLLLQRMRNQGVPVVAVNTYATLASLVVLAGSRGVETLADLRGKRLAADMSSSEFHILRLIAEGRGLRLEEEVEVLQAVPSVARAHLESGEVDAILTFEPTATLALSQHPDYRVVFRGEEGWRELTGGKGWLLVSLMREDWLQRHPELVEGWMGALQEAVAYLGQHPEEADALVASALHLPPGVFSRALREGRIVLEIRPAAEEREHLVRMFEAAVRSGFVDRLPDRGAIYEGGGVHGPR